MPQTLTGWILIAAVLLSGMGAGSTTAGMLDDALGDGAIRRRAVFACLMLFTLMVASGLLLWLVEGRWPDATERPPQAHVMGLRACGHHAGNCMRSGAQEDDADAAGDRLGRGAIAAEAARAAAVSDAGRA